LRFRARLWYLLSALGIPKLKQNKEMATPSEALAFILSALAEGKTVYVSTMLRHTKITKKTFQAWEKAGRSLFKLDKGGELKMAQGKGYVSLSCGGRLLVALSAS
jgi:hypothetical protein